MGKRIGFVGCYSHDIVLMLAKVLAYTEKTVLIRDCNKRHILRASVPIPGNIKTEKEDAEYDGVFFTERRPEEAMERYAFELIDFGVNVKEDEAKYCTDLIVITDMLLHHIRELEESRFPREKTKICIIRDAFEDICKKEPEVRQLLGSFTKVSEFFLPPDLRDVRNRYVCETSHEYSVSKASPEMQDMIYSIAGMFCTDFSEKEIRKKVKRSERRRYR